MEIHGAQSGYFIGPARQSRNATALVPTQTTPPPQSQPVNQTGESQPAAQSRSPDLGASVRSHTLAMQLRAENAPEQPDQGLDSGASASERLLATLDQLGVIREPAEQGQFIDTRA